MDPVYFVGAAAVGLWWTNIFATPETSVSVRESNAL